MRGASDEERSGYGGGVRVAGTRASQSRISRSGEGELLQQALVPSGHQDSISLENL